MRNYGKYAVALHHMFLSEHRACWRTPRARSVSHYGGTILIISIWKRSSVVLSLGSRRTKKFHEEPPLWKMRRSRGRWSITIRVGYRIVPEKRCVGYAVMSVERNNTFTLSIRVNWRKSLCYLIFRWVAFSPVVADWIGTSPVSAVAELATTFDLRKFLGNQSDT